MMRMPKNAKVVLIIIVGLLLIAGSSYPLYKYLRQKNLPNIILITIDALRPDHLGCYGYKRNTSPNIDKLAREGVTFTQAITQGSWTIPSVTSLLTETYPHTHGVLDFGSTLHSSTPTLANIFKNHNYRTAFLPIFMHQAR